VPGCATTVRQALNVFSRRYRQIRHAYFTELLLAAADPEQDAEHVTGAGAGDSVRRHDMAPDFEAERLERTGGQVCVPGAIAGRVVGGLANERCQKFNFGRKAAIDYVEQDLILHSSRHLRADVA
jgi:hypothetical protein